MCRKSPEQCNAKVKCKCCIKRQEMSKIRNAYLKAKENGEVKSYKIVVDSGQETGKLNLNEIDELLEQQTFIINIKE